MRSLGAGLVAVVLAAALLVWPTGPAQARVFTVTTSVSMPADATETDLRDAVREAVHRVLARVRHLEPSLVALTDAYVDGDRLHVSFLVADEAGERMLKERGRTPGGDADPGGHVDGTPDGDADDSWV